MADPAQSFRSLPPWGKAAVAAGGLVAVYLVYRARSGAAAAAPAAAPNIDPQTGYPTGSTSDLAALAAQNGGTGFPVQASSAGVTTTVGTTSGYGTNAAWAQAAEAGLSQVGFDPVATAAALGAYLAGQTLTAAQASIVFAATAEYGAPPVAPPPVVLGSSSGPAVTGNTVSTVSGGRAVSTGTTRAVVAWTPHGPAKQWRTVITGPGPINGHTSTVGVPQATYSGLESRHRYSVLIQPLPSGTPGRVDFTTR